MQRKGSAVWQGGLKDGKGTISTDSGVLHQTQYSFSTRFENGIGTNPEELLAAAHAGCFTMALSAQLGNAGMTETEKGKEFLCPCHTSAFDLKGRPLNSVPPRGMDELQVEVSKEADPEVRVRFQRFRTQ